MITKITMQSYKPSNFRNIDGKTIKNSSPECAIRAAMDQVIRETEREAVKPAEKHM